MHLRWLAVLAALLFLAPAVRADELTCKSVPRLVHSYLQHHIRFKEVSDELEERAGKIVVDRIDPSKVLFLQGEVEKEQAALARVLDRKQDGCADLVSLHRRVVAGYEAMEAFVRETLARPDYAVDYSTSLVLDPDDRGFPASREAQRELYTKLIHFQMSNYLAADEDLAEAKRRLVHRYELLTLRAGEQDEQDLLSLFLDAFATAMDPHSNYLSKEQLEEFQISMGLSLEGIGVALSSKDGYSVVERIIPGGAADSLGQLKPNDRIIAVAQDGGDWVDIVDMALRDVVRLIRGSKGTKVHLTILRQDDNAQRFTVSIVRDEIDLEEQAAKLRFDEVKRGDRTLKLGVLELPSFYGDSDPRKRRAATDVARLLRQVREEGADGLVLDLSRNGGGLLDHAVRISGFFLRSGGIVAVQDPDLRTKVLRDPDPGILYSGPLVVLVSRVSASASEILAGSLKDYDRAVIVGDDHTFGKGTVQTVVTLPQGLGAMKVTTGMFYLPGGVSTQHEGVTSHVQIPSYTLGEDFGERFQDYALKGHRIEPFRDERRGGLFSFGGGDAASPQPWRPIDAATVAELARRSEQRIVQADEFDEIREHLAKEDEAEVKLSEIQKQRDDAEDPPEEPGEAPEDGDDPDDDEPSLQAREAVDILADLVELQEQGTAASL